MTMHEIFRDKPAKTRTSVEDERTLIAQAQSGAHYAAAAQWDLLKQYRGLLQATSYKIRARAPGMTPEQVEDLEGDLALVALDAIRDFNLETHIRLAQTLTPALARKAAEMTTTLSVPRDTLKLWFKILRAHDGDLGKAAAGSLKMGMAQETFRAIHQALDNSTESWASTPFDAGQNVPDELTHELAHTALAKLKDAEREVIELAYGFRGDPKSDAEVAEIVGDGHRAVKMRRLRALEKMRALLTGTVPA